MKRLLLVILFALVAFYLAWPAISAWQIYGAIKEKNASTLARKVDFPSVRESMRPAVKDKISGKIDEAKASGQGGAALIAGLVKGGMLDKLTTLVLQSIVTPENMIRLAGQPGTLPEKIERIVKEQMGQFGGLGLPGGNGADKPSGFGSVISKFGQGRIGSVVKTIGGVSPGKADAPAATSGGQSGKTDTSGPPPMGLSNIKSIGFAGPFAFDIAVARDPAAGDPDLTARMEFKGFDWRLTRVVPHLK